MQYTSVLMHATTHKMQHRTDTAHHQGHSLRFYCPRHSSDPGFHISSIPYIINCYVIITVKIKARMWNLWHDVLCFITDLPYSTIVQHENKRNSASEFILKCPEVTRQENKKFKENVNNGFGCCLR